MGDEGRSVADVRKEIDALDAEIVERLVRRANLAREIGQLKEDARRPYFTPEREHEILARLKAMDTAPLQPAQVVAVFREIISAARAAEKPISAAFWGPEGTFSHVATIQTFGRSAEAVPVDSIREVFLAVEQGRADYGVVPIENSIAGVVPETLDMFPQTNVKICDEQFLSVHHLLASGGNPIEKVERVYAGPQPAAQCRGWLRERLPKAEVVSVAPTVRAAQAALGDPNGAAIVNELTVELLGMTPLAERIEDSQNNRTRFVVLGFNEPARTGKDKTSMMFNLRNRPGELYRVLGEFERHGVNLLMIESRPAQRASFEYLFYIDCAGHIKDENLARAVAAIQGLAMETILLGSYPSHDPNLASV
jgi:chorismate mutase/prephenate dehydratase